LDTFDVTILGCSSATPAFGRNPTSQLVRFSGHYFLVDCGEATQMQLRKFSIKFQRIGHIFISHLHGDHFLGLPGLLSSMHLLGRTEPLHLYAEEGLKNILDATHKYSRTVLQYPVIFHPIDMSNPAVLFEDDGIVIRSMVMKHSIPCCGFMFEEKQGLRRIIKEKIEEYKIPIAQMESIKKGSDFTTSGGKIINNDEITIAAPPPRKYAYCSDTIYNENILSEISHADLLYHEATFTEEMKDRAKQTMHCTAKDAGTIALKADAGKLIIGHFSARYKDLNPLLEEAKQVFPNTFLAEEGVEFKVESLKEKVV
jgi:ribonuclease Z